MTKVLIIGANGFIGSNLCRAFTARGHEVWSCDLQVKSEAPRYFQVAAGFAGIERVLDEQQFQACINASGSGSVAFAEQHPGEDREVNVINVARLLEHIRKFSPVCRFMNFSSAAVYGNPAHLPIEEEHPLEPISVYGRNKLDSEETCLDFYNRFKLPTCSMRVFSAYGPGLRKQLFWDIYSQWKKNSEVKLSGTGNETRDFIFIDDLADAVELIMNKSDFRADVINVASGISTTIANAAWKLLQYLEKDPILRFTGSSRPGDPLFWKADIRKLTAMGFKSRFDLDNGLERYATWLRSEP